ncbi:hypothetical protein J6590_032568 [Homalodisca vitripennis]|nr:hypothetical protein J6590_032568 [Homalodisca vitripennis]
MSSQSLQSSSGWRYTMDNEVESSESDLQCSLQVTTELQCGRQNTALGQEWWGRRRRGKECDDDSPSQSETSFSSPVVQCADISVI